MPTEGRANAGIVVDLTGNVLVADSGNNRIQRFSGIGTFLLKFGAAGAGDGQLNLPQGLAIDVQGNVYVADYFNNRIQKFAPVVVPV
jgi:sugar lactone lactonase YvrE